METSLRIILLIIGVIIVSGIIWDSRKNRIFKRKIAKKKRSRDSDFLETSDRSYDPVLNDVVLVTKAKEPVMHNSTVKTASVPKKEEMIMVHVMAIKPQVFLAEALSEALEEAHCYYGDMQIFHRYEDIEGNGKVVFSIVSMVEPGYFEMPMPVNFKTPGITLFFALTNPNESIAAFEVLLRTAKQLAMRLEGELKDEQHKSLTIDTIDHYRERVRQKTPLFSATK